MRPMNDVEKKLLEKMKRRGRAIDGLCPDSAMVEYAFDDRYTVCRIVDDKDDLVLYGVTKRTTYALSADRYNAETGRNIAFTRAICAQLSVTL